LARNSIMPRIDNIDFSVVKNNYIRKISESFNVQFRAEASMLSTGQLCAPTLNANQRGWSDGGNLRVGQPNPSSPAYCDADPNRQIHVALKLIW